MKLRMNLKSAIKYFNFYKTDDEIRNLIFLFGYNRFGYAESLFSKLSLSLIC